MDNQNEGLTQKATQNRDDIAEKYRLKESPELFQNSSEIVRESMYTAIPQLEESTSPEEFGRVLDKNVCQKLKETFGGENPGDYGSRAAQAFVERTGTKARDEIEVLLTAKGLNSLDSRRLLSLLPHADSCEQVGRLLTELGKLFGFEVDDVFELGKRLKIDEFKAYYDRNNRGAKY